MTSENVKTLAHELGFELAGVAAARPTVEALFYPEWLEQGFAAEMEYLKGRRGEMRADPRSLLPSAQSVICVGLVYNTDAPYSTDVECGDRGWISRYAWGEDYHGILKQKLHQLVERLREEAGPFDYKVCVDTSPLLERAYAHRAGLGWIGHNSCLIDQRLGSWVFLGEVLTSLELESDQPAPFRCGSCTRCIDACPTDAIVPTGRTEGPAYALDSNRCISYWNIELRGPIPEQNRAAAGAHLFGCDICQDVCPWNRSAAVTGVKEFQPKNELPSLAELAALTKEEFNERFKHTPIERARYGGFLRNVAVAMGNSGERKFLDRLRILKESADPMVREHAEWAIGKLENRVNDSEQLPAESR